MKANAYSLVESAMETLKSSALRVTEPRKALIRLLAEAEKPLSCEEILTRSEGEFDLVTVYRNMEVFREQNIVQTILLESGKQLFELTVEGDHHHHIVCRTCHRTLRLELCFGGELERYASDRGFEQLQHKIEVFGLCAECVDEKKD
jgi:Fe2+ or Zn2+ uptake regulation protein